MRAVIKVEGDQIDDQLHKWLENLNWIPNERPESDIVEQHKTETLEHIPKADRTIAERTHLFTLFDEVTRSWGTVCRPNKNRLTFRLKNPVSEKLKKACEKLVHDIHSNNQLRFAESRVEVLEPGGEHQAFEGSVVPPERWELTRREKQIEYRIMLVAAGITLISFALTSPFLEAMALSPFSEVWRPWVKGILERLGTTAIVTSIISGLEVYLFWKHVKDLPPIRWTL